jgi:hypothetical protein
VKKGDLVRVRKGDNDWTFIVTDVKVDPPSFVDARGIEVDPPPGYEPRTVTLTLVGDPENEPE